MGKNADIGWDRRNRTHFDEIVAGYDRIRPTYPDALSADIFAYAGRGEGKKALEIGAGTGKATAPFLDAGYDVTAVEIGENMAAFLRQRFGARTGFEVIVGAFEDVALEEGRFDLLYAASAFHWVDPEIGCPKAYRLLKSGGMIALFRYNAMAADGDPLYEAIQSVYQQYFHKPYRRPATTVGDAFWMPAEMRRAFRFEDLRDYGFTDISKTLYTAARTFDADAHLAMLDTHSDHRSLPEEDRAALYDGIRNAIERHGGLLTMEYTFQLYMGRKR